MQCCLVSSRQPLEVGVDLLSTEREAAVAEATRLRNQIHTLLAQIDPEYERRLPSLTSAAGLRALAHYISVDQAFIQQQRAACVRRLAQRLRLASALAEDVADQIRHLARSYYEPLTELCGVNLLTAGMLGGMQVQDGVSRPKPSSPPTPAHRRWRRRHLVWSDIASTAAATAG
jgi:hypothetical protein